MNKKYPISIYWGDTTYTEQITKYSVTYEIWSPVGKVEVSQEKEETDFGLYDGQWGYIQINILLYQALPVRDTRYLHALQNLLNETDIFIDLLTMKIAEAGKNYTPLKAKEVFK